MPSPSASSKFVLSVLKLLGILKISRYTQNIFCTLKWANLCREIYILSIHKILSMLKNLSVLKHNFEEADRLGTSWKHRLRFHHLYVWSQFVFKMDSSVPHIITKLYFGNCLFLFSISNPNFQILTHIFSDQIFFAVKNNQSTRYLK